MKILVIGSGGREHALVWKLKSCQGVEKVYCSPGNGGIGRDAELLPAPQTPNDWNYYIDFVKKERVELTVVGPEAPLVDGIVDAFRAAGLKIFGPSKAAAQLEGSKIFAKHFMRRYGIPTANFDVFDNASDAYAFLSRLPGHFEPTLVVKADGLAAGKGVAVCSDLNETRKAVERMLVNKAFGDASSKIVIEEGLTGEEISLMALCDGSTITPLMTARDYKRVGDGNTGPNTGGMGAVSPSPVPGGATDRIQNEIMARFLKGIQQEGLDYRGLIYFGIMLTPKGPQVLEFNVRFGDPETEVVLPLIKSDLAEALIAVCDQRLSGMPLDFHREHCVTVVCASRGYPDKYETGLEIKGLEAASKMTNCMVFHSGTVNTGEKFVTAGGRVLNCVARGKLFQDAKARAYELVREISFDGMHYRNDIGGTNAAVATTA